MWKYLIAWIPMIIIAIANGLMREKLFANRLNELQAHQASTATLILFFGIYIWIVLRILKPESTQHAIMVGLVWLALTVVFEFLFGHIVAGHSWSRLLNDYNIFEGRVWILILIWVAIAPLVFYKLQQ